jgi:hypothetical protein
VSELPFIDPTVRRMIDFLKGIGVSVRAGSVPETTVVPGIHIERGGLVVDETRLRYPGDLLHEAGHIVVRQRDQWESINGDVGGDAAEEMAAIAWSYAAAIHVGIDPAVVFHPAGYKGGSEAIISSLARPGGIGVPMLEWFGMSAGAKKAAELGVAAFPAMLRWTR